MIYRTARLKCTIAVLLLLQVGLVSCNKPRSQDALIETDAVSIRLDIPTLSIAEVDGEPFFRISQVLSIPDGFVVVSGSNLTLHVLDDRGAIRTSMGGKGRGPGEFFAINGVQFVPPDTLVVYDPALRRFTSYTTTGQLTNVVVIEPVTQYFLSSYTLGKATDSALILTPDATPVISRNHQGLFVDSVPLLQFTRDGAFKRTLGPQWQIELYTDGRRTAKRPFGFVSAVAFADDRIYIAPDSIARIEVWTLDGDLAGYIEWEGRRASVAGDAKAAFLSDIAGRIKNRNRRKDAIAWFNSIPWPDSASTHGRILTEAHGEEVLVEIPSLDRRASYTTWLSVDRGGAIRRVYEMPKSFRPHVVTKRGVLGVWTDESGAEYVRSYERGP
jgi:hypothetical protein